MCLDPKYRGIRVLRNDRIYIPVGTVLHLTYIFLSNRMHGKTGKVHKVSIIVAVTAR